MKKIMVPQSDGPPAVRFIAEPRDKFLRIATDRDVLIPGDIYEAAKAFWASAAKVVED